MQKKGTDGERETGKIDGKEMSSRVKRNKIKAGIVGESEI